MLPAQDAASWGLPALFILYTPPLLDRFTLWCRSWCMGAIPPHAKPRRARRVPVGEYTDFASFAASREAIVLIPARAKNF